MNNICKKFKVKVFEVVFICSLHYFPRILRDTSGKNVSKERKSNKSTSHDAFFKTFLSIPMV